MARKPDIFDEIILYLKENGNADFSLSEETRKDLFSNPPPRTAPVQAAAPVQPIIEQPVPVQTPVQPVIAQPAQAVQMQAAPPPPAQVRPFADVTNMDWAMLKQTAMQCAGCELCKTRTNVVFGEGPQDADLMFIGEGPGADEDAQGRPFVGKAGELLTRIITAMNFDRASEVYIANIVKCRPPGNRNPLPEEAELCKQYLLRQIELVKPKVIVLLGAVPLFYLFKLKGVTKLRGQWLDWNGIPVMPTLHPAFLLRDPRQKIPVWQDMKQVMKVFGKTPPAPPARNA